MATTTLDNLILESGRKTGIGAAAEPLTRELLKLMTAGPGGLTAFLDRFRSAGMGNEVQSFLGGRNEATLPTKAVDTVIGEETVATIAERVGVAPDAAKTAFGFEIPRLIGMLTPGGRVTSALPSDIQTFVRQPDHARPLAAVADEQMAPAATAPRAQPRSLMWLWMLLALAVLAGLLWTLLSRNHETPPSAPAPRAEAPASALSTPAPTTATPAPAVPRG